MERRKLITGFLSSLVMAPAIVRASALMPIRGERYCFWEWSSPLLPDPLWFDQERRRQDLIDGCLGPNGQLYKGTWTFYGKARNIYGDEQVAFRKEEYPVDLAA